jgi:hypothetical protein
MKTEEEIQKRLKDLKSCSSSSKNLWLKFTIEELEWVISKRKTAKRKL